MKNQHLDSKQEVDANEIVKSVIESQNKRLDLEKKNLELREKELEFSNQYALAALQAQKENLADERNKNIKHQKNTYIIIGIVFLGVLIFGSLCLLIDKEDVFKELIKIIGYSVIPSLGAYYYGFNKGKKDTDIPDNNE